MQERLSDFKRYLLHSSTKLRQPNWKIMLQAIKDIHKIPRNGIHSPNLRLFAYSPSWKSGWWRATTATTTTTKKESHPKNKNFYCRRILCSKLCEYNFPPLIKLIKSIHSPEKANSTHLVLRLLRLYLTSQQIDIIVQMWKKHIFCLFARALSLVRANWIF